jgi:hypothetical protein
LHRATTEWNAGAHLPEIANTLVLLSVLLTRVAISIKLESCLPAMTAEDEHDNIGTTAAVAAL